MTMNLAGKSTGAPATIGPKQCRDEFWPQPCNDQPIPSPDAAFRVALAAVDKAASGSSPLYPNQALVTWRPDGAALATVLPGDDVVGTHRSVTITLLDTKTGASLGVIEIPVVAAQGDTGMVRWPYVSWSPTGKQLAVVNDLDNTVQIATVY